MPYEIRYKIPNLTGNKVHVAGPYDSFAVAEEHRRDIVGYAGVTECYMSGDACGALETLATLENANGAQPEEPCAAEDGVYER